ncbi:uncharacterized protein LOC142178606 [Nicotiana tabacum]|uniref:Uncharacterized protein LOC142178606 n=1 Tax=Nicotiana tabacum TaxID=4097 RepID=A0AC58U524_TOBAC
MNPKGPKINHLSYADDLILFSSGDKKSVKLLMETLEDYQDASGQEINNEKRFFLKYNHGVGRNNKRTIRRLQKWTGFKHMQFPFTYLGCPIYIGRKRIYYFADLATKVLNKAGGWQGRLL